MKTNQIINADNVETLRGFPDDCIDSIVTDPPYGLAFMGKKWDYDVPSVELWQECLRVLKPGGHLLAFAGTRTQHRMAVRIEDAGFEIRDMIAWVYSGMSKTLDVTQAIDREDARQSKREKQLAFTAWMRRACPLSVKQCNELMGTDGEASHYFTDGEQPHIATRDYFEKLRPHFTESVPEHIEKMVDQRTEESQSFKNRRVVESRTKTTEDGRQFHSVWAANSATGRYAAGRKQYAMTEPATEEAKRWAGWGTGIRPCFEPITLSRKPFTGTLAENLIRHGAGAVNVEAGKFGDDNERRHPSNLTHDGSEEATSGMPYGCSRYFYCAKADQSERRNSRHPTVKPVALMRYLVRLVTPIGGIVLDPFGGSGTTAEAARLESCKFVLIEQNAEYCRDAQERLRQGVLF